MVSPNCFMVNYMPKDPDCSGAWLWHQVLNCFRGEKKAHSQCSLPASALTTDGNNLGKSSSQMWGAASGLIKVKKSCFYNHPLIHRKVSLPFHKYMTYLENVMILQGGWLAKWLKRPSHLQNKGSIAVTALRSGQKPFSKTLKKCTWSLCP